MSRPDPPAAGRPGPETATPPIPDELWAKLGPAGFEGNGTWVSVASRDVAERATRNLDLIEPVQIGISLAAASRLASEAADAARAAIVERLERTVAGFRSLRDGAEAAREVYSEEFMCGVIDGIDRALSLARSAGAGEGREGGGGR